MYSFNMAPTELLTGLYITRYNAPKLVSEHMGHAVVFCHILLSGKLALCLVVKMKDNPK